MFIQKPLAVLVDAELNHADKCVYDAIRFLAWKSGKGACQEPMALIAALANTSRRQAIYSVGRLCKKGHIEREETAGATTPDILRPVVHEQDKRETDPAKANAGVNCAECGRKCKRLSQTGWCRGCMADADLMRRYQAAQLRLGAEATHAHIVQFLEAEEADRRWLRIARKLQNATDLSASNALQTVTNGGDHSVDELD